MAVSGINSGAVAYISSPKPDTHGKAEKAPATEHSESGISAESAEVAGAGENSQANQHA